MSGLKRVLPDESGFTVVEFVVAAAILFIVSTGIMGALAYASTANASTAMRQLGLELANQRMEQARNMPYDTLGTQNGYPIGTIPTPETVLVPTPEGNRTFVVVTEVEWAVDSASNLSSDKAVRITVSWASPRPGSVMVESNVVGKSSLTNVGDVKVSVVDAQTGDPVSGATFTIKPASGLTASKTTVLTGFVRWGKVPAGSIIITGTCSTHYLDMSPVSGAAVISGQLNPWTIQAYRPSSGTVHVHDQAGNNLKDVDVTISGPAGSSDWSCPNGTGTARTDDSGNAFFAKLRSGATYTVTGVLDGYTVETSPPVLSTGAGGSSSESLLQMIHNTNIRVTVLDDSTGLPISGATVTATGPTTVSFPSLTDATYGQATSNPMGTIGTGRSYTVTVVKNGYLTKTGSVTLSQYELGEVTVRLSTPPPTTIKVTVLDDHGAPIKDAKVSATGPTAVTFAALTDGSGYATSNDMGAIGTLKTYTVSAVMAGFATNTGSVTFSQYTQGTLTIVLSPPNTTIKVRVTNSAGTAIQGATVSATGPTTVVFASPTDASGYATSNNMGAIGTNQTYTITVRLSGWAKNTGTVTLSEGTQGAVTVKLLQPTLLVYGYDTTARTIYVYTSQTSGGAPAYSAAGAKSTVAVSFYLPAGTYWVSRRSTYGASGAVPKQAIVVDDSTLTVTITSGN